MQRSGKAGEDRRRRWGTVLLGPALASLGLGGCAGVWDEITSRDFSVKGMFAGTDPLVVLRDSPDGDKRAKALRSLREPKQSGGTEEDQEAVLKILATAATAEKQPLCRLAAIETLGHFKDPRAVESLKEAFFNASAFAPDTVTVLRCQAVTALGETQSPAAIELLTRVVREPPAEGTDTEKQQTLDVRIAAARALGKFRQQQATEALVRVLQGERDVALRNRAHESLEEITGKKLPADSKEWDAVLTPSSDKDVAEEPGKRKILGWF